MLGTQPKTSTLFKLSTIRLLLLLSTLSPLVFANTTAQKELSPSILFVSGSHSNGQKTALLQAGAPDYGFTIATTSAADIKKLNNKYKQK